MTMDKKIEFNDFITSVPVESQDFVKELHNRLTELGCRTEIKSAKSGYMVSYIYNKKTISNYVFRKKGMLVRIYGAHAGQYEKLLETLPDEMIHAVQDAPICKRLAVPDSCNPRCSMGYDFRLKGERYQKCRNGAFMFLVCPQNNTYIQSLILSEIEACERSRWN